MQVQVQVLLHGLWIEAMHWTSEYSSQNQKQSIERLHVEMSMSARVSVEISLKATTTNFLIRLPT